MEISSDEVKILTIYTGGTIGMLVADSGGYSPEPYFLTQFLRTQARFHDPLQDSLFSHAGSSQNFRNWSSSNSGRTTPTSSMAPQSTLPVRSTRPIGVQSNLAPNTAPNASAIRSPKCTQISEKVFESNIPSLVTPRSKSGQGGKRIRYAILEVSQFNYLKMLRS